MSSANQLVNLKDLPEALTALETADRTALLDLWHELIGAPPPKEPLAAVLAPRARL